MKPGFPSGFLLTVPLPGVLLFLFLSMGLPALQAEDAPEFRVEGVMMDRVNPSQSLAVIDGEPMGVGSQVGDFQILEVQKGGVRVKNINTRAELFWEVSGAPKELDPKPPLNLPVPETPVPSGSTAAKPSLLNQLGLFIKEGKNPMIRVWELMGIRDLAQINNAAVHYYNQKKEFPKTFEDLAQSGFLPASLKSGVTAQYHYYFGAPVFGVHADPVDPSSGMRCFFIGLDAVIRESTGSSAGPGSPEHDYPGRKK